MKLGQLTPNSSFDDVASAIVTETIRRGYTRAESVAAVSTGIQESGLRPKAVSPNGLWRGIYQQDSGYPGRDDPNLNIAAFLDRLDAKRRSAGASADPFKNIFWLQQRPSEPSAEQAYRNGRQAYLTEIRSHIAQAEALYDRFASPGGPAVPDNRPDFNEYPIWSNNNQDRGGTTIDLFLIHTQEGDGNADSLAKYCGNPAPGGDPSRAVSYHYTISEDPDDHGVTVCDVVDTDDASWSVLSANNRSINLCFAGSRSAWTRQEWLSNAGRAIDVAAYLAVQDCQKYGITIRVLKPPYSSGPPGISDHKYVTEYLGDGSHTDVGPNFPWDVFSAAVAKYAGQQQTPAPTPTPVGGNPRTDRVLLEEIWDQLRGPGGQGWPQLGGRTLVDALAEAFPQLRTPKVS